MARTPASSMISMSSDWDWLNAFAAPAGAWFYNFHTISVQFPYTSHTISVQFPFNFRSISVHLPYNFRAISVQYPCNFKKHISRRATNPLSVVVVDGNCTKIVRKMLLAATKEVSMRIYLTLRGQSWKLMLPIGTFWYTVFCGILVFFGLWR